MSDQVPPVTPPVDAKLGQSRQMYAKNRAQLTTLLPLVRQLTATPAVPPQHPNGSVDTDFRIQQLEPLFLQANSYIETVVGLEPGYRQLRNAQVNLGLDVDELEQLQAINDDEVAAGLFNVQSWSASATLISDQTTQAQQTAFAAWIRGNASSQLQNALWTGENNLKPSTTYTAANLSDHSPSLDTTPALTLAAGDETTIFTNLTKPVSAFKLGALLSYRSAKYSFDYIDQQLAAQIAPISARLPNINNYATYMGLDGGFRERRRNVAHNKLAAKLAAIAAPDGSLNYGDRIKALLVRAQSALREAVVRYQVVSRGMKLIYNVDVPALPTPAVPGPNDPPPDPLPSRYLTELVMWANALNLKLARLTRDDQSFVVRVSLKALMGENKFKTLVPSAATQTFRIDSQTWPGLKLLRMRGIAAWVNYEGDIAPGLMVTPPSDTAFLYGGGVKTPNKQAINTCWIPRPEIWGPANRRPEIVGSSVLFNASPFGEWSVKLMPAKLAGDLGDIILELYMVAQQDH